MSVVVAVKKGDKVYVGADSQVTKGGTRATLKNPNNYKIWKVRGADHCLMAHVGQVRDANVVRLIDDLVTYYNVYRNHIDYEFVVKKVFPDIVSALKEAKFLKDESFFSYMESSFLFIYKDQLYVINTDGCVLEIDDYFAIGSGSDQAIGSLLSTEDEEPETRIIKAIKASAASDIYVDYPIVLTNSETTEFKVIYESDEKKMSEDKKGKQN